MKKAAFDEMCRNIRQSWTSKDGVILKLNRGNHGVHAIVLCVGGHRNAGMCARHCVVWEGDSIIYDGPLMSENLKKILTAHHICYGEITNVRLLEHDRTGIIKCYKDPTTCKSRTCTLCGQDTFQVTNDCTAVNV